MGLREDIQTDVAAAYDTDLADAVNAFTGRRETVSGEYDPVTGSYPTIVTNFSGRGVFGSYSVREVDGSHILITDVKLDGVLQNELINDVTGLPETPKVDDKVTRDGVTYSVINVAADPAQATYTLQLRRT
ncbi:MAG TPA: glutamate 5-kinase [Modicisalibacter sp.]|nr:glutamate 5-kinase [Modicisalibacter sp.]